MKNPKSTDRIPPVKQPQPHEQPTFKSSWRVDLQKSFHSAKALLTFLQFSPMEQKAFFYDEQPDFPVLVPEIFAQKIKPRTPHDPLLLQVLATQQEKHIQPGYSLDAVHDHEFIADTGVLQKYKNRALLLTSGSCPLHCRYCFRKHFAIAPGKNTLFTEQSIQSIQSITSLQGLHEVILSGGDPLYNSTAQLKELFHKLGNIPSLKRIRIHTRFPIALPSRITPGLIECLKSTSLPIVMVIHCNHPQEIDATTQLALQSLKNAGVTLLNQSVLLKGINDNPTVLCALSESLFAAGVLPYYLHALDKVQGCHHFAISDEEARQIIHSVQNELPGYLVPKLVREIPHHPSKTIL
jgi:L-lysine 2,3-aminomutase